MHDAHSRNPKIGSGSLAGEDVGEDERTKIVKEYIAAAKRCVETGDCSKADALKAGALVAGVDPVYIEAVDACVQGSEEACAKFAVTTGATEACTTITAGAATAACMTAMPVLVDMLWPVIGPAATGVVTGIKGVIAGLGGAFVSVGKQFLEAFGFGGSDDEVNFVEFAKQYRAKNEDVLLDAKIKMVDGLEQTWKELRQASGLPPTAYMRDPAGKNKNARNAIISAFDIALAKQPLHFDRISFDVDYMIPGGYMQPTIKGTKRYISLGSHEKTFEGYTLQGPWTPGNLWLRGDNISQPKDKIAVLTTIAPGAAGIVGIRLEAMQAAFGSTLGWLVASVTREATPQQIMELARQRHENEGSGWTWILGIGVLAGVSYGGYKWYKKQAPK